ncbi:Cytochrome P450 [Naviculisporaceae sp. PSN 640]
MLVMLGTGVWGLVNGLGNPTLELTMDELVVQAKLFIASAVAWVLATSVVKVAVLWLYTRIFSMAWFVRLARILMVICACYFITFLVVFITHCDPVDQQWNPVPNGSCRDVTHTELASNTINSIIDLTIVCMPLPCLWSLKMPLRKKITVLFMFSLGFITIGIMFYRIYVTVHSNPDGMIALADVGVLSGMEVWLGFIVACVPTAAPFFKTYVSPALSKASESLFGSYGSSKPSSQSHHVNTIGGSGPAGGSGRNKSGKGRWLGSSYTEISLDYTTYGERPSQDIPLVARPGAAAMSTLRPAEVTVFLPEVLEAVGGRRSECIKGEFYELLWPEFALFAARNKTLHSRRRRDWNLGFSPQAIKIHEQKVLRHVDRLDKQLGIEAASGNVVNATDFLLWFTFDIMTDFTFSKSLNLLQDEKWRYVVAQANHARSMLGPLTPTPWLLQVGLKLLPRVCEPTAQSLAGIFHELAMHPQQIRKLREALNDVSELDNKTLTEVAHLDAVIQEAMRLHTNLLTAGVRKTTENGIRLGHDIFIPPHTAVVTPMYTISRREDCFERANEFIPERWTTRPEMVRNAQAHVPFSLGRYNCVGQELGLRIMRYAVTKVVKNYDFCYAPGEDGSHMERDKLDRLTAFPGRIPLCFAPVSPAKEESS